MKLTERQKAMAEQMSLESYKREVEECLTKKYNCTIQEKDRLMKAYEDDFQEAFKVFLWKPMTMALAMQMGY